MPKEMNENVFMINSRFNLAHFICIQMLGDNIERNRKRTARDREIMN